MENATSSPVKNPSDVCELDLIFNFHKAYYILHEVLIVGELQESSKKTVARLVASQDIPKWLKAWAKEQRLLGYHMHGLKEGLMKTQEKDEGLRMKLVLIANPMSGCINYLILALFTDVCLDIISFPFPAVVSTQIRVFSYLIQS